MMSKISYRMLNVLKDVRAAGPAGKRVSNTNATLTALERRGLVEGCYSAEASKRLCFDWKITAKGLDLLGPQS